MTDIISSEQDRLLFLPDHVASLEEYASEIVAFLEGYEPIFDYLATSQGQEEHTINFLQNDHWNKRFMKLEHAQEWYRALNETDGGCKALATGRVQRHWPASLCEFVDRAKRLYIPYRPQIVRELFHLDKQQQERKEQQQQERKEKPSDCEHHHDHHARIKRAHRHLDRILHAGMKAKKLHEVNILNRVVRQCAKDASCRTVVDIGSGQGYLSSYIALEEQVQDMKKQLEESYLREANITPHSENEQHVADESLGASSRITVVGIDTDQLQTEGAITRMDTIANRIARQYGKRLGITKQIRSDEDDKPKKKKESTFGGHHITAHLELTMSEQKFLNLVNPLLQSSDVIDQSQRMLIIGLHTCGDLASTMLRLFVQSDASAMVNVGCCYHKMTECDGCDSDDEDNHFGYPMSNMLKSKKRPLSTSGRYLACNVVHRWDTDEHKQLTHMHFLNASFRCALQVLLQEKFAIDENKATVFGRVPHHHHTTFGAYAFFCISKLRNKLRPTIERMRRNNDTDIQKQSDIHKAYRNTFTASELFTMYDKIAAFLETKNEAEDMVKFLDNMYMERYGLDNPKKLIPSVSTYWAVRAVIGPVIEALLMVDRLLFLREQEEVSNATCVRIFDPVLSPRGIVILARKRI